MLRRHIRQTGLLRAVQPRALATRDALLGTGRRLLNEGDFESMSIAELASANGLSVGSFYGRFRDKEAYFAVLQELVIAEWREAARSEFDPERVSALAAGRIVAQVTAHVTALFRNDRGFIRATLKHASTHPKSWTPLKRVGMAFASDVVTLLAPRLGRLPRLARAARVRFAMQVLYGTLVNAVLNDPGPLVLADRRLEAELARMLSGYLGLETTRARA
ncbi:MAG: TetR/AcrR family transcriptional regulator [Betaproteobacteria bacterium]|nr:TetR/AcrR family transcriptional regulator [Betaproteobacteria bacterium]